MTEINTKYLSQEEFVAKQKELEQLNASIELWSGTNISKKNRETIQTMMTDLATKLYALDCAYLVSTLETYKDVLELMKAKVE